MAINLTNFQGTYSMACRKTDKYLFWKYFFLFWEMLNVVTKIIRLSYYFENVINEHQMRLNRLSCCFKKLLQKLQICQTEFIGELITLQGHWRASIATGLKSINPSPSSLLLLLLRVYSEKFFSSILFCC